MDTKDLQQRLRIYATKDDKKVWNEAADALACLETELAEAKRDAVRYRWLRIFPHNLELSVYGPTATHSSGLLRYGDYLDEAIDAAMQAGTEGGVING